MKRILFLSCNYPYGLFGPSTLCTSRIMEALCQEDGFEVHNISYPQNGKPAYKVLDNVHLHYLDSRPKAKHHSKLFTQLQKTWQHLTYPQSSKSEAKSYYEECLRIINGQHFDLVVAQCYPEKCVWTGAWLKENGYVNNLMVIFWDNIYGKLPRRVIPEQYALKRQREVESFIAQQADSIVSLYPIQTFFAKYGDVPEAERKRKFLGIPSILRPKNLPTSPYQNVVKADKINILYSGTIFRLDYVKYLVDMLNMTENAEQLNLIFFSRGIQEDEFQKLDTSFRGSIVHHDWIPVEQLLAIYPTVDFFVSFPGNPTAICSKVYEYMSYGKPIMLLYDDDRDVNITTFANYPILTAFDVRKPANENADIISHFISENRNKEIPFEDTERLFPSDTAKAYVDLIANLLKDNKD